MVAQEVHAVAHGFLPTPSARRATLTGKLPSVPGSNFYPRPPRGGRRLQGHLRHHRLLISTHALREEGDPDCPAFR